MISNFLTCGGLSRVLEHVGVQNAKIEHHIWFLLIQHDRYYSGVGMNYKIDQLITHSDEFVNALMHQVYTKI